jgi:hypothetical protein
LDPLAGRLDEMKKREGIQTAWRVVLVSYTVAGWPFQESLSLTNNQALNALQPLRVQTTLCMKKESQVKYIGTGGWNMRYQFRNLAILRICL